MRAATRVRHSSAHCGAGFGCRKSRSASETPGLGRSRVGRSGHPSEHSLTQVPPLLLLGKVLQIRAWGSSVQGPVVRVTMVVPVPVMALMPLLLPLLGARDQLRQPLLADIDREQR